MLNKRQFIRALGDVAVAGAVATSPMMAYAQKNRPPVDDVLAAYGGIEDSAAWRSQAAGNIETLRKGNFGIQVLDASGKPVPNAEIHAKLYRHDFVLVRHCDFPDYSIKNIRMSLGRNTLKFASNSFISLHRLMRSNGSISKSMNPISNRF